MHLYLTKEKAEMTLFLPDALLQQLKVALSD